MLHSWHLLRAWQSYFSPEGLRNHLRALPSAIWPTVRPSTDGRVHCAAPHRQVGARAAVGGRSDGGDGRSWRQHAAPAGWRANAPRCVPPRPRADPRARSARQPASHDPERRSARSGWRSCGGRRALRWRRRPQLAAARRSGRLACHRAAVRPATPAC
jgi:hypothetical protein